MQNNIFDVQQMLIGRPSFGLVAIAILAWSFAWKGMALWKAAGQKEMWWFIALLFINTLGILEILYLYVFTKGEKGVKWWWNK